MRVVVFGVGRYYQKRKQKLRERVEIIAFIDNDSSLWGNKIDEVEVFSPEQISSIAYDRIILMSVNSYEMKNQLINIGADKDKIYYYEEHLSDLERGILRIFCNEKYKYNDKKETKRILIITTNLNYNGGTLAAIYAAKAFQNRGYNVILAAPDGNLELINEVIEEKINIVISPGIVYLHKEELLWIQQFDVVLVNVLQMMLCACEISKIKPVMWWIHEPKELYKRNIEQFLGDINIDNLNRINIYAVSNIALKNFNFYFPGCVHKVLPYGIPDYGEATLSIQDRESLVFAIIGGFSPRKAQDIFIEAVKLIDCKIRKGAQFWMIGAIGDDEYSNRIKTEVSKDLSFKILGELTRSEVNKIYEEIDVVVCPSLEEPMSIVITEGMMYGKVCIASSDIGMAEYIVDGENGLTCSPKDPMDLSKKMEWVIRNKRDLNSLCFNARKTYEKYFSMNSFSDNLEKALEDTLEHAL